jgi:hypothetical protein
MITEHLKAFLENLPVHYLWPVRPGLNMAVPTREVASLTNIYLEYVDGISAER